MKASELESGGSRQSGVRSLRGLESYNETPGGARPGQSNVHRRLGLGGRSSKKKPERQERLREKGMDGERESDLDHQRNLGQQNDLHVEIRDLFPKEEHPRGESAWPGLRIRLRVGLRIGLRWGRRWGWPALKWTVALSLPFFVLVSGSMYAYQSMGLGTWSSIGLGMFGTFIVFFAYAAWLWRRVAGKGRLPRIVQPVLLAVVVGYSMYGLLYLSAGNTKDSALTDDYSSLHPLMRLAASTYFLFDRDAVVTDLSRTTEDYLQMGLPINEASLHFRLEDRYVHAMDLRTIGRSRTRNLLTVAYFRLMGFRSLHHVATADHLHVSLPVGRP